MLAAEPPVVKIQDHCINKSHVKLFYGASNQGLILIKRSNWPIWEKD